MDVTLDSNHMFRNPDVFQWITRYVDFYIEVKAWLALFTYDSLRCMDSFGYVSGKAATPAQSESDDSPQYTPSLSDFRLRICLRIWNSN